MLDDLLGHIDKQKDRVDAHRPLPAHTAASLREHLDLEWTYNSNRIEGNTLTLRETKVVLEGITVGGKALRDHLEAINHRDAIHFVDQLVTTRAPLNARDIKDVHALVLRGIEPDEAGRYRQQNVIISGASTTPPNFLHVEESMERLLAEYSSSLTAHPIERIAELHTRFVEIHPFADGNGRIGRLLMNLELMKEGYPPTVIRAEDRLAYYEALDIACVTGGFEGITRFVADGIDRSLRIYLELLEPPQPSAPTL